MECFLVCNVGRKLCNPIASWKKWHIRSKTPIKIDLYWVLKNQIESVEGKQRRRRRSRMTYKIFLHLEMRLSAISTLHLGTLAFLCSSVVVSYEVLWETMTIRNNDIWGRALMACTINFASRRSCILVPELQAQNLEDTLKHWFVKAPQYDLHFFASWAALHNQLGAS